MTRYYADANKYLLHAKNPIFKYRTDKSADQLVHIHGTVFGITIRPGKCWNPFCQKLFREVGANGVWLDNITCAPNSSLDCIADLERCERLTIETGESVDLRPLAECPRLSDLQLEAKVKAKSFDLASIKNLARCQVPVCSELESVRQCDRLISLHLSGGRSSGCLNLKTLPNLEEFFCSNLSNVTEIMLHHKVKLRSLALTKLKLLKSVTPLASIVDELLVVSLDKTPQLQIEWLAQARKLECIALRLGEIPSINFLRGLNRLQLLDLFGSKVLDRDLSFRDSLKNELDSKLWSEK